MISLNREINKKVAENNKDLSELSNSTSKCYEHNMNEQLLDSKYWNNNNEKISPKDYSPAQYINQFENLKKQSKENVNSKNEIRFANSEPSNNKFFNNNREVLNFNEDCDDDVYDTGEEIQPQDSQKNQVNSIFIKPSNFQRGFNNPVPMPVKCVTDPDELYMNRPQLYNEFFPQKNFMLNQAQKMSFEGNFEKFYRFPMLGGFNYPMPRNMDSFASTQYSNNKICGGFGYPTIMNEDMFYGDCDEMSNEM